MAQGVPITPDDAPAPDHLRALDLAQVGITATVDAAGRLGPVGGLWAKILAAARDAATLGLLRVVVVAGAQPDVPAELLREAAFPLRAVRAATLPEAVARLYEEHGPRQAIRRHERERAATLEILGRPVPLETHYQDLPLVREIHPARPAKAVAPGVAVEAEAARREAPDRGDESAGPAVAEAVSAEQAFGDFRSVAPDARSAVPRFVVLGAPGSGKSTLARYLAWRAAGEGFRVSGRRLLPVRVRLRDWEAWAAPRDPLGAGLADYLAHSHRHLPPPASREQWQRWLESGEVLLLLDGLDELGDLPAFRLTLESALAALPECPTVLFCRTESFEPYRALCPDLPAFSLAPLERARRDAWIRAFPAERPERFHPDALIAQLNRMPHLDALAASPLLLSIVCYVTQEGGAAALPSTRGRLVDRAVERLLARPRRVEVRYRGERFDLPLARRKRILERAALSLLAGLEPEAALAFTEARWLDALSEAAEGEGYGEERAPVADALLRDLIQNAGLVQGNPARGFALLHPAIHQHLAASALARLVGEGAQAWDTPIRAGAATRPLRELVERKAWLPAWQEVIVSLAGRLDDPAPLLVALADGPKDDLFRHRLALAARCLPELPPALRARLAELVDRITTLTFTLWWRHRLRDTLSAVPHLTCALPDLGEANGRVGSLPVLAWCRQRLGGSDWRLRLAALDALEGLSGALPESAILQSLLGLLADADWRLRLAATQAVAKLGDVAATPQILSRLVENLRDEDWGVRSRAAQSLGSLGGAAATPEVLAHLSALLGDDDELARVAAAKAIGALGGAAATPETLGRLAGRLGDQSRDVRAAAARALGNLGEAAVTPALLDHLARLLSDDAASVRDAAALTVECLGSAAGVPAFLARLADLLGDEDWRIRSAAARAVGGLRSAGAAPEVLAGLAALLKDEAWQARSAAARATGQLGGRAATPEILARLVERVGDGVRDVQRAAGTAIRLLGSAAARPEVVSRLTQHLRMEGERPPGIRQAAAKALGDLGGAAATPEVLAGLAERLEDRDGSARAAATKALGQMGATAATPRVLTGLAARLRDQDWGVRARAAQAVGALGGAAATPEILEGLGELLGNEAEGVREAAVQALGGLGATAATPEFLTRLVGLSRHEARFVRSAAARAVGRLGSAAASPGILARLADLLGDGDGWVRESAAEAAGRLGSAAATRGILARLAARLEDEEGFVRHAAADALQAMMSQGVRVFASGAGGLEGRPLAELSR